MLEIPKSRHECERESCRDYYANVIKNSIHRQKPGIAGEAELRSDHHLVADALKAETSRLLFPSLRLCIMVFLSESFSVL